ncbi:MULTISPECIES: pheST operon leader peptide PheM [Enterobacteriaceae]|nr:MULTISPECIES: pheST operon leader peptide PheM [Enterobacteriaceae]EHX1580781.1 pheST operon leader peptide PheM [Escherichia coli]EKB3832756.1 pheST operon leader peptide PheM [Escherichia coli]EKQ5261327.1 pheST operon leader peptide PheM [Escherichia coli]ELY8824082.1 pheST operon leader peptide PheM [Escherichia coli]MBB7580740.1 pheST operon leader peptide PheM [Escherichia coli]
MNAAIFRFFFYFSI